MVVTVDQAAQQILGPVGVGDIKTLAAFRPYAPQGKGSRVGRQGVHVLLPGLTTEMSYFPSVSQVK